MSPDRRLRERTAPRALLFALALAAAGAGPAVARADDHADAALNAERNSIEQWREQRVSALTSDTGWLTLAGLFWLQQGENTFGRAASNTLVLDNASLAKECGSFVLTGRRVRFVARPGSGVTPTTGRPRT